MARAEPLNASLELDSHNEYVVGAPVSVSTPLVRKNREQNARITRSSVKKANPSVSFVEEISSSSKSRLSSEDEGIFDVGPVKNLSLATVVLRSHHPLSSSWTFWFYRASPSLSWEENQIKLASVATVEDFWQVFNVLKPASQLSPGQDYSLFRSGVFPDWSDAANTRGGRWILRLGEAQKTSLDAAWLDLLCLVLGEAGPLAGGKVTGCAASRRAQGSHKLALWLREAGDLAEVVSLGRSLKERLDRDNLAKIKFSAHKDAQERMEGVNVKPDLYL